MQLLRKRGMVREQPSTAMKPVSGRSERKPYVHLLVAGARAKWAVLFFAAVALVFLHGWAAETGDLKLDVVPATIALEPPSHNDAKLLVILRNPSKDLKAASLKSISPQGINITIEEEQKGAAQTDFVWIVTVQAEGDVPAQSNVILRVDFGPGNRRSTVAASVPLAVKVAQTPAHALTAKLEPDNVRVDETRTETLELLLDSTAMRALKVSAIGVASPPWLKLTGPPLPLIVPPMEKISQKVTLETTEKVVPGTYKLLVNLSTEYADDPAGKLSPEPILATSSVEIGVPALSETMKLFGVASFLLIPGILMLVAFGFPWAWATRRPGAKFPLVWNTPEFFVIAVTLSGLYAFLYPLLGGTNYLKGFNLQDIAIIWLLSILIGLLAAPALRFLSWLFPLVRNRCLYSGGPRPDDGAEDILRKLAWHQKPLKCRSVTDANSEVALMLPQFDARDRDTVWLVPQIEIWHPDSNKADEIRTAATAGQTQELVNLFDRDRGLLAARWKSNNFINNPTSKNKSELGNYTISSQADADLIV